MIENFLVVAKGGRGRGRMDEDGQKVQNFQLYDKSVWGYITQYGNYR